MSKVSICIPAYNSAVLVRRLIDSIKIQTYKDYEIIITDDSSTDAVNKYITGLNDKKIHYYKNLKQLGATDNCNKAISKASGEYIKVMHHDDWFTYSDSLERFVKMLDDNRNVDIAFSGTNQVSGDKIISRSIEDKRVKALNKSYRTLYNGNWIGAPSAIIMRNKNYFFDTNLKWLVDMELYARVLKQNSKFVYTKEPLVSIGIGDTQLTNSCEYNWDLQKYEYRYVLKKFKLYRYFGCMCVYLKLYLWHFGKNVITKDR